MLEAALEYAANGWPVFPCLPRAKEPLTKNGFKDATADKAKIAEWWAEHPDANIGIATGKASGLVVVDFDPRNGGDLHGFYRRFPSIAGARVGQVLTGGNGRHLYFRYPDGASIPSRSKLLKGIDLKSDGGYVIAPPSVHPSGGVYDWSL